MIKIIDNERKEDFVDREIVRLINDGYTHDDALDFCLDAWKKEEIKKAKSLIKKNKTVIK